MTQDKIKTKDQIREISENLRKQNKKIVTTNGSFDILHYAHVNLLEKAKQEGDILIVLINSDSSIRKFKGENRPIIPEHERAIMLSALQSVDYIVIFNEDKPLNLLKIIKPNTHVKGGTFIESRIKEEKELLESWGGKFKNLELEEGFSTTNIINKILEKNGIRS
jgi:D-glycero-beta-D-manno-heptose 1-phosphate adenylyltransferase